MMAHSDVQDAALAYPEAILFDRSAAPLGVGLTPRARSAISAVPAAPVAPSPGAPTPEPIQLKRSAAPLGLGGAPAAAAAAIQSLPVAAGPMTAASVVQPSATEPTVAQPTLTIRPSPQQAERQLQVGAMLALQQQPQARKVPPGLHAAAAASPASLAAAQHHQTPPRQLGEAVPAGQQLARNTAAAPSASGATGAAVDRALPDATEPGPAAAAEDALSGGCARPTAGWGSDWAEAPGLFDADAAEERPGLISDAAPKSAVADVAAGMQQLSGGSAVIAAPSGQLPAPACISSAAEEGGALPTALAAAAAAAAEQGRGGPQLAVAGPPPAQLPSQQPELSPQPSQPARRTLQQPPRKKRRGPAAAAALQPGWACADSGNACCGFLNACSDNHGPCFAEDHAVRGWLTSCFGACHAAAPTPPSWADWLEVPAAAPAAVPAAAVVGGAGSAARQQSTRQPPDDQATFVQSSVEQAAQPAAQLAKTGETGKGRAAAPLAAVESVFDMLSRK